MYLLFNTYACSFESEHISDLQTNTYSTVSPTVNLSIRRLH